MNLTDWIGTVGVFVLLLAYFLVALNVIDSKGLAYILLNLVGAVVAGFASYFLNYWPFIILEGAWTAVSLYSLVEYFRTRGNPLA
ncbi:hypothetical protein N9A49_00645 [Salibacteraceae bacterium]|jgi:hypothetical protein|nr:hypothetical protein [Salibacteraceae bacterium]HAQ71838.1 hypothetical protein [Flavobacteriales bacterium]MDB0002305.1 hypothetical protein [Salibacteraceae bacterium]MDB4105437.1 hypothetical protein [Salibacteraceae bacterium]MDB9708537.1 hypothetical protein [Salibacteraceae bacterium]